ncbi:MAG: polysaccharide deacetylase family protein [Armatimonadetes bacterium]|nr:polysaccharide deacetylase family protein [Armatimonadota bacterium]
MGIEEQAYSVPVLMYHSVGPVIPGAPWSAARLPADNCDRAWRIWTSTGIPWADLRTPIETFEDQLRAMSEAGYAAVTLEEVYAYMLGERNLPSPCVAITFDDGYLDNYVYAYPLLKKYGFKATVFMSTDFVDPCPVPRPTLEDVWSGKVEQDELENFGFLSWAEMKAAEESGILDIQSHTVTHTWQFSSQKVIDFHSPESYYPWLAWNECPPKKHRYMWEDQVNLAPLGAPVYEHQRALAGPCYIPDQSLRDYLSEVPQKMGGEMLFSEPEWRQALREQVRAFIGRYGDIGRMETEEEYLDRARFELVESKRLIEENLGREKRILCWPGGKQSPKMVELAKGLGYVSMTKSADATGRTPNVPGADAAWIRRIGCQDSWKRGQGARVRTSGRYLLWRLGLFQGKTLYQWPIRIKKAQWALESLLMRSRG